MIFKKYYGTRMRRMKRIYADNSFKIMEHG